MKQSPDYPPNYVAILEHLPEANNGHTIFCYGDTIYNPNGREITRDLEVHEGMHSAAQGGSPDLWWEQYLADTGFRLAQELEGYGAQYAFLKEHIHGKLREWVLDNMARALSGQTYGGMISFGEARSKIRNYQHTV